MGAGLGAAGTDTTGSRLGMQMAGGVSTHRVLFGAGIGNGGDEYLQDAAWSWLWVQQGQAP